MPLPYARGVPHFALQNTHAPVIIPAWKEVGCAANNLPQPRRPNPTHDFIAVLVEVCNLCGLSHLLQMALSLINQHNCAFIPFLH
jgi:hypothetical protein